MSSDAEKAANDSVEHVMNIEWFVRDAQLFMEDVLNEDTMSWDERWGFEYTLVSWGRGKHTDMWEFTTGVRSQAQYINALHATTSMHWNIKKMGAKA